ncbi:MAG: hypothetical protein Q9217_003756, partial [Psora testacea]
MVSNCCGSDECADAGIQGDIKMIRGMDWRRSASSSSLTLHRADGTVIEPAQVGEPPEKRALEEKRAVTLHSADGSLIEPAQVGEPPAPSPREGAVVRRDGELTECTNYAAEKGFEDYTRPAEDVQIVATGVDGGTGGSDVEITKSRISTETVTFSGGLNI